jgi:hypothetical protein
MGTEKSPSQRYSSWTIAFTGTGMKIDGELAVEIGYRRLLILSTVTVIVISGANLFDVLEWFSNVLTLLGL